MGTEKNRGRAQGRSFKQALTFSLQYQKHENYTAELNIYKIDPGDPL